MKILRITLALILAQNGNYVYFVSDKRTFKTAGFTTTANIGIQYIHE